MCKEMIKLRHFQYRQLQRPQHIWKSEKNNGTVLVRFSPIHHLNTAHIVAILKVKNVVWSISILSMTSYMWEDDYAISPVILKGLSYKI